MEQEDSEEEFERLWRKRPQELRGIIALMGPPYTRKTQFAQQIGRWAKCPALCVQHFFSRQIDSDEELVQQAFTNLCKVAKFHLSNEFWSTVNSTVVIKSRLNSTFELQHLLHLVASAKTPYSSEYPLLIIECRFTNEYLWKQHFESALGRVSRKNGESCSWYRPGSWNEMEKARDDYYQSDWDLLLQQQQQLVLNDPIIVRRLIVDPDEIFSFSSYYLLEDFADAIKYLLITPQGKLINISRNEYNYYMVELHELRPHLFEMRLSAILAAKGRSNDLCPRGGCIFKYIEEIEQQPIHVCGVCGKQVDIGTPVYTCHLCILTLHKSCAERIQFKALHFNLELLRRMNTDDFHELMPKKHACKSCAEEGEGFNQYCSSCNYQTHLKCGLVPTIIYHNSHPPHFISLMLDKQGYRCKACGEFTMFDYSYCCKPCGLYYHLKCAFLPLELLKHKHGGHEHVMKLLYSHHDTDEDMEPEESYWCEVCYRDMDPQAWCYACQNCPYFATHLDCAGGYKYFGNLKNARFVEQIQSQLKDAMANPELHEEEFDSELHDEVSNSELHKESDSEISDIE